MDIPKDFIALMRDAYLLFLAELGPAVENLYSISERLQTENPAEVLAENQGPLRAQVHKLRGGSGFLKLKNLHQKLTDAESWLSKELSDYEKISADLKDLAQFTAEQKEELEKLLAN